MKGGLKLGIDDFVLFSLRIGKFEIYYILKKLFRWEFVEYFGKLFKNLFVFGEIVFFFIGLCFDLFFYFRDFCIRKYIMKFVGDFKYKVVFNLDNYDRVFKEVFDVVLMILKMFLF